MYPNVNAGDLAFYYHLDKKCEPGDIVAVKNGKKRELHRVIACGGDVVNIDETGEILVNGMGLDFERIFSGTTVSEESGRPNGAIKYPYTVPDGAFFLVNDNRNEITDSRSLGAYLPQQIDGKVISILRTRGL